MHLNPSPNPCPGPGWTHQRNPNPGKGRPVHHPHPPLQDHPSRRSNQRSAQQLQPGRPDPLRPHRQRLLGPPRRNPELALRPAEGGAGPVPHPPHFPHHVPVPDGEQPSQDPGRRQRPRGVPAQRHHLRQPGQRLHRRRRRHRREHRVHRRPAGGVPGGQGSAPPEPVRHGGSGGGTGGDQGCGEEVVVGG
ncbi:fasciclin-like arabinogalactan protein 11 [Phtheirospermum japonicum]|uniref:Fasciclin-like arabinogalactan protein 11 n=1 Tax=Phtheirospermum japonicum TaxID=374723 RepID=A0A830D772_9LAMI|nr:fasciclin-like arabinogalactan protein 11 [Phtheirospermum japonicum]